MWALDMLCFAWDCADRELFQVQPCRARDPQDDYAIDERLFTVERIQEHYIDFCLSEESRRKLFGGTSRDENGKTGQNKHSRNRERIGRGRDKFVKTTVCKLFEASFWSDIYVLSQSRSIGPLNKHGFSGSLQQVDGRSRQPPQGVRKGMSRESNQFKRERAECLVEIKTWNGVFTS